MSDTFDTSTRTRSRVLVSGKAEQQSVTHQASRQM